MKAERLGIHSHRFHHGLRRTGNDPENRTCAALDAQSLYFGSVMVVSNHFMNARAFVLVSLPEG